MKRWLLLLTGMVMTGLACGPLDTAREISAGVFRVYYVAVDGNDDNDCESWAEACLTIRGAVEKADDGDTIRVGPGTISTLEVRVDRRVAIEGSGESETMLEWGYPAVLAIDSDVVIRNLSMTIFATTTEMPPCIDVSGGASALVSHVTMRDCGVGVHIAADGDATLEHVTVTATDRGAIWNEDGTVLVRSSRLVENNGMAIINTGTVTLEDTAIDRSLLARTGSTALPASSITNAGHLEIVRSTVSRSQERGISNSGTLLIENSTVSSNQGHGVSSQAGELTLRFATIAGNGEVGMLASGGVTRIGNSILSGNRDNCFLPGGTWPILEGVNISEDCRYFPEGIVSLGPLADNGGPTETHALLAGSDGIDAVMENCLATDQRGVSRPLGGGCEVGAYEVDPGLPAPPVPLEGETPPLEVTPSVDLPQGEVVDDSLCWTGPGSAYEVVSSVVGGTAVQIIGEDLGENWWVIDNPRYPGVACWVPRLRIEVPPAADLSGLAVFPVPPVPTPTERPQAVTGCLVYNDLTPNDPTDTICVPRACTPNDQPGGSCSL